MFDVQELITQKKQEKLSENWLAEIHDLLMCEYGWIPFNEFKKLPIPLVVSLVETITERKKHEEKHEEKELRKLRLKRLRR